MPIVNNLWGNSFLGECQKHKGHGWLNCTPCAIEKDEKRIKELSEVLNENYFNIDSFIKPTTMENKFDFDKAIQGEPIYCNGKRVCPYFDPANIRWELENLHDYPSYWGKNGNAIGNQAPHPLTTTPPKKKVKKTVTVTLYKNNLGEIMATTTNTQSWNQNSIFERREIEIEYEEPGQ